MPEAETWSLYPRQRLLTPGSERVPPRGRSPAHPRAHRRSQLPRPEPTCEGYSALLPGRMTTAACVNFFSDRVDGNKRTAWAAAWTFLHINGVELAADFGVDRVEDLMNEVATRDCELASIAAELAGFAAAQTG